MTTPTHGDERNRGYRTETTYATWQTPQGPITVPAHGQSYTVSERWCEVCGEWVEAKGIMGGLLCQKCYATWDKSLWYSPTQPQDPTWVADG